MFDHSMFVSMCPPRHCPLDNTLEAMLGWHIVSLADAAQWSAGASKDALIGLHELKKPERKHREREEKATCVPSLKFPLDTEDTMRYTHRRYLVLRGCTDSWFSWSLFELNSSIPLHWSHGVHSSDLVSWVIIEREVKPVASSMGPWNKGCCACHF